MLFLFIFLDIYSLAICNYKSIAEIILFKKCKKLRFFGCFLPFALTCSFACSICFFV